MSEHEASSVHVASVKLLLGVWVALMIGTWLTVAASNVDLGWLNIWIGLGIATGKAVLVALYYMHLRWDRPFNAFVFLGADQVVHVRIVSHRDGQAMVVAQHALQRFRIDRPRVLNFRGREL